MKFCKTQFDAAMREVYETSRANPDQSFLLRLSPRWHDEVYRMNLELINFDIERMRDGPLRLGVGNVQVSRSPSLKTTHELTVISGSVA